MKNDLIILAGGRGLRLKKIEKKFRKKAIDNIKKMTSIKLKRKILEKNY
tara:strand:+ start:518 stop:664 length:147 start_codon:yes stop_codon:yes gene_type:complete